MVPICTLGCSTHSCSLEGPGSPAPTMDLQLHYNPQGPHMHPWVSQPTMCPSRSLSAPQHSAPTAAPPCILCPPVPQCDNPPCCSLGPPVPVRSSPLPFPPLPSPQVVNPRKKMKKKKYLNSGTVRMGCVEGGTQGVWALPPLNPTSPQVTLLSFAVEAEHTFLDYIRGG